LGFTGERVQNQISILYAWVTAILNSLRFSYFFTELCGVQKEDLHFGLQIFDDMEPEKALEHWIKERTIKRSQFYKVTVTISGSTGTYRQKSKYGVLTVYYHNKKLRDIIVGICRDSSVGRALAW
jgi:predicted component of type VI protein secretion system